MLIKEGTKVGGGKRDKVVKQGFKLKKLIWIEHRREESVSDFHLAGKKKRYLT